MKTTASKTLAALAASAALIAATAVPAQAQETSYTCNFPGAGTGAWLKAWGTPYGSSTTTAFANAWMSGSMTHGVYKIKPKSLQIGAYTVPVSGQQQLGPFAYGVGVHIKGRVTSTSVLTGVSYVTECYFVIVMKKG